MAIPDISIDAIIIIIVIMGIVVYVAITVVKDLIEEMDEE